MDYRPRTTIANVKLHFKVGDVVRIDVGRQKIQLYDMNHKAKTVVVFLITIIRARYLSLVAELAKSWREERRSECTSRCLKPCKKHKEG